MTKKAVFGSPILSKTAQEKRDKAERLSRYQRESTRLEKRGYEVLWAAIRNEDDRLIYCVRCGRVIGWKAFRASHECCIVCSKHEHLENVECAYWVDWRTNDLLEMGRLEMPGTIWG